jgi:hypothetical protein
MKFYAFYGTRSSTAAYRARHQSRATLKRQQRESEMYDVTDPCYSY